MRRMIGISRVVLSVSLSVLWGVSAPGLQAQPAGLAVGETAPEFTAAASDGTPVSLKALLVKGPVVLVFYRGAWCPYCTRYMGDLQDSLPLIQKAGATVIAVTPELQENIQKTQQKSGASFAIIYDRDHVIMDLYKTTFALSGFKSTIHTIKGENLKNWNGTDEPVLPVPATYIIGKNGKILARHFDPDNISVRMPVKRILEELGKTR